MTFKLDDTKKTTKQKFFLYKGNIQPYKTPGTYTANLVFGRVTFM